MDALIIYNLKTTLCLALFYLCYKLFMSKESFHRLNRIVILGTSILSIVLPFCVITIIHEIEAPKSNVINIGELITNSYETSVSIIENNISSIWDYQPIYIFILGFTICLVSTIGSIVSILRIIHSGERRLIGNNRRLVLVDKSITPFNWFNYIVISKDDYVQNGKEILVHEQAHINFRHSWDVILINILCCIQWFNPIIWLIKHDLQTIHEYEVDEEVVKSGVNIKKYQLLLIKKAVGSKSYSIANSLNHSNLKKRITMMLLKKSNRTRQLRVVYVLPLVFVMLTAFAETRSVIVPNKDSKTIEVSKSKTKEGIFSMPYASDKTIGATSRFGARIHPITKKMLTHNGVDIALREGTQIFAMFDGIVKEVKNNKDNHGHTVRISQGNIETFYANMGKVNVKVGQKVLSGECVGTAGISGRSTGVHLHLELRKDGKLINPESIIDFKNGVIKPQKTI